MSLDNRRGFLFSTPRSSHKPLEETQGLGHLTLRGGEMGLVLVHMEFPSEDPCQILTTQKGRKHSFKKQVCFFSFCSPCRTKPLGHFFLLKPYGGIFLSECMCRCVLGAPRALGKVKPQGKRRGRDLSGQVSGGGDQ